MDRRTFIKGAVIAASTPAAIGIAGYDPLLNTIREYQAGGAAYSERLAEWDDRGEEPALGELTYLPAMRRLCHWDMPASTPASAIEALKLLKSEQMICDGMGAAMVDAAIGYLETLTV